MHSFFITSAIALAASIVPTALAEFPGSTFGIAYNTTSDSIPASGHITTFKPSSSPLFSTTISNGPTSLGAFITVSGLSSFLNEACGVDGLAALVPADPAIVGLKYVLQWTKAPLSDLPEGSISEGFQLGPAPTFDTLINVNVGDGSWKVAEDESGQLVVGWSDEQGGISVTLVKADISAVQC